MPYSGIVAAYIRHRIERLGSERPKGASPKAKKVSKAKRSSKAQ
jgi:hypothetical protein